MNHVALLATLAASAFLLPLLVQLGGAAGVPRAIGVPLTLVLAAVGALLLWRRRAVLAAPGPDDPEEDPHAGV